MKRCSKCKKHLSLDCFYRDRSAKDGHEYRCKGCSGEHAKPYLQTDLVKNRPKHRARWAVNNALRDKRLFRQPCEICGAAKVHGHHDSYDKPLEVRWLCHKHHYELHYGTDEVLKTGQVPV